MSLYNMLFGESPVADILLKCLGISRDDVPRYRNCYIDNGRIAIHTRTGGGNRERYGDFNDELTKVPGYLYDEDDDFDCTYATFYFSFPEQYSPELKALESENTDIKPSEQWQALFKALDNQNKETIVSDTGPKAK